MKTGRRFTCALLLVFASIPIHVARVGAQQAQKPSTPSHLQITIETSRSRTSAGSSFGVVAQIKNVSSTTVYLKPEDVLLILPPELHNPGSSFDCCSWAGTTYSGAVLALKSSDNASIFWDPFVNYEAKNLSLLRHLATLVGTELHFIFFPPGDYKVSVSAKYWTDPKLPDGDYRHQTETAIVTVAAPQFVILFGAAIGGLIAYLILGPLGTGATQGTSDGNGSFLASRVTRATLKLFVGVLGSVLLSAVITILLARISETQFLIRVTVTDFWGGVAIGFAANYAGAKILERIVGRAPAVKRNEGAEPPNTDDRELKPR
jgi:hypothetical protein